MIWVFGVGKKIVEWLLLEFKDWLDILFVGLVWVGINKELMVWEVELVLVLFGYWFFDVVCAIDNVYIIGEFVEEFICLVL